MRDLQKYIVIYGHYGSGKTTFALNLALLLAREGKKVTLADLDIVNPYFRSSDYSGLMRQNGIKLIAPFFAGTTLDVPSLPAELYSVTAGKEDHVLFDIGGDAAGAAAFGRFSTMIRETGEYAALYILNQYRSFISKPAQALKILREIETAARLPATHCVNNSHLGEQTVAQNIKDSFQYADDFVRISGLPLFCTTVPKRLLAELSSCRIPLFPVTEIVKPPWGDF